MIFKAKVNTTFFGEPVPAGSLIKVEESDDKEYKAALGMIEDGVFKKANEDELKEVDEAKDVGDMNVSQLKELAEDLEIEGFSAMKKAELIEAIEAAQEEGGV